MKSTPGAVPQIGVPHQFSSGWEIFQNIQLARKIYGTPHKKNRIIGHKI